MNNIIHIVLLLHLFLYGVSTRNYFTHDRRDLDDEFVNIIKKYLSLQFKSSDYRTRSESDDPVDVNRWNQLNQNDIKNMPSIDDYSDEDTARRWLQWYTRISERYYQVGDY